MLCTKIILYTQLRNNLVFGGKVRDNQCTIYTVPQKTGPLLRFKISPTTLSSYQ